MAFLAFCSEKLKRRGYGSLGLLGFFVEDSLPLDKKMEEDHDEVL